MREEKKRMKRRCSLPGYGTPPSASEAEITGQPGARSEAARRNKDGREERFRDDQSLLSLLLKRRRDRPFFKRDHGRA